MFKFFTVFYMKHSCKQTMLTLIRRPYFAVPELSLHCLHNTLKGFPVFKWLTFKIGNRFGDIHLCLQQILCHIDKTSTRNSENLK